MAALRAEDPAGFTARARESMAAHVAAMVGFQDAGAEVFDYGNSIRGEASWPALTRAFDFPGFVPAYIRPLFCEGRGPFRWAALSGDPADIAATDAAILDLFPQNEDLARWIRWPGKGPFQGLPARICWLGYGERHLAGLRFNELVSAARCMRQLCSAAITWTAARWHRLTARPRRWPRLRRDRRLAAAERAGQHSSGASWVSIHHGGGVGIGRSSTPDRSAWPTAPSWPREARTGADQRPGHGRDQARRRGL